MKYQTHKPFYDFTRQEREDEEIALTRELISNLKSVNALLTGLLAKAQ